MLGTFGNQELKSSDLKVNKPMLQLEKAQYTPMLSQITVQGDQQSQSYQQNLKEPNEEKKNISDQQKWVAPPKLKNLKSKKKSKMKKLNNFSI